MNDFCTPLKKAVGVSRIFRGGLFALLFALPTLLQSQSEFDVAFECGVAASVDAAMIGCVDSTSATIVIPGDTSTIDSILVEIAVKGNPVFWGPTTITTSAGQVVVVPFPGIITNTGSNEEAALYRAWVAPCQSLTATTPVANNMHYDDWQSMTTFQIRHDQDCLAGTSSGGDILIFHACDTFLFNIDTTLGPTKDVSIIAPISEIGDVDTTRSAIISVNYVHNNVMTNLSIDTFYGNDNIGRNALLFEKFFQVPGNVDTIKLVILSPNSPFSTSSCVNQFPFGGDSFIIGTIVVSASCDECCTVETNCEDLPMGFACKFSDVPPIPAVLLDSSVMYVGNQSLDSLAFAGFGGTYTTTFCDTVYIIASDMITGEGCPGDTGYVFRSFVFYNLTTGFPTDTCELVYMVLDSVGPMISCPGDTMLQCSTEFYPPYATYSEFVAAGGSASDACALDTASFDILSETSDGNFCPETITRTYVIADSCGSIATCVQTITVIDTIPPMISCPGDMTIECPTIADPETTGFATATDDCAPELLVTYSDVTTPGDCPQEYTITRTWYAQDLCENTASCTQHILVVDTTPPSITCPSNVTIECSQSSEPDSTGFATAVDTCDPEPSVTYSDAVTPLNCPQQYVITRTWTAMDACGNVATCQQSIRVVDTTPPTITCPEDLLLECPASTDPGDTGFPIASDNCDPEPDVTYADVMEMVGCPAIMSIIRTWYATDDCGNVVTCYQVIRVVDTTPPSITCPEDITIECGTDLPTTLATATDLCSAVSLSYVDSTPQGTCPMVVTRTHYAMDECGNTSSCTQHIFIEDTTPPEIGVAQPSVGPPFCDVSSSSPGYSLDPDCQATVCAVDPFCCVTAWDGICAGEALLFTQCCNCLSEPVCPGCGPLEVECGDEVPVIQPTVSDVCDPVPFVTYSDTETAGVCPVITVITRTWFAQDECGNMSSCTQTISIVDTTPPSITCPSDVSIECTESTSPDNTGQATASDVCDLEPFVTYSDEMIPGSCPQMFTIIRTWSAEDACGNRATCTQTISVDDTTPPMLTCPPNGDFDCAQGAPFYDTYSAFVAAGGSASDNCALDTTSFDRVVTVQGECPLLYTILYTITDQCGNFSSCVQQVTVTDDIPPSLTCPDDVMEQCVNTVPPATSIEEFLAAGGNVFDNCALDSASFMLVSNTSDGLTCPETITRVYQVADFCGNISACTQVLIINDTTPPEISCPASITIECSDDVPDGTPTYSDNCDAEPMLFPASSIIPGDCPGEFVIFRSWQVVDACGNSASCTQVVTILDTTPPTITCPASITIECGDDIPTSSATASDNCSEVSLTYSDSDISGSCPMVITRTFYAEDACGNVASCTQYIIIEDTTPPVVGGAGPFCNEAQGTAGFASDPTCEAAVCAIDPFCCQVTWDGICADEASSLVECLGCLGGCGTFSIECGDDIPLVQPEVTDICDANPFVTYVDVTTQGQCPVVMIITRTWYAEDACNNIGSCSQVILILDTTPPDITCPVDVTVDCTSGTTPDDTGMATASDICDSAPAVTYVDAVEPGNCPQEFTISRTWYAEDACGNVTSCVQTIAVVDDDAPLVTCPPSLTVECVEDIPACPADLAAFIALGGTATENCGGPISYDCSGGQLGGGACGGTVTYVLSFADQCGNSSTCTWIVTVDDNTPPTIVCPPDVTLPEGSSTDPDDTGFPTVSDNCSGVEPEFTDVILPGVCAEAFIVQRTWTVSDDCGNSTSCVQLITVDGECIVDLELTKDVDMCVVNPGDNVDFTITVTNEGEITISSLTITDYIPVGLVLNDPDWTAGTAGSTGQSASIVLSVGNGGLDPTGLDPGESVMVDITLQVSAMALGGQYTNVAEISMMLDDNGNDVSDLDIDSDPDNDDTNDPPGEDDIDDAVICTPINPVITGDGYVCPGETVTYCLSSPYNPNNNYSWSLTGGGTIISQSDTCITVQWQNTPGGPFVIWLTESTGYTGCPGGCSGYTDFPVYIQGIEPIACNDHINISLGPDCEFQLLSGIILEGEQFGNNGYFVIIYDQNGNIVPNATLTGEHVNQLFNVTVMSECNGQSCWGEIWVEDKLPPQITCTDVTLNCGEPTDPVYTPVIGGTAVASASPGSAIGPNAGVITTQDLSINVPAAAQVTDVNVTIDLDHTFSADLDVFLIGPDGTMVELATDVCGGNDNWDNVTFDDEAAIAVAAACVTGPPTLTGSVQPEGMLSDFDGLGATGTWTLMITDDAGGDAGVLNSVSLSVSYFVAMPYAPNAYDACGDVTLNYSDVMTGEDCTEKQIIRTWTATDESGNTAQCVQTITILPLTLDGLEFPETYIGSCGANASTHPSVTGWPTVNGVEIADGFVCNIFLNWEDHILPDCGGGTKIVRTWTVLDWCTVELQEGTQIIKLIDDEAPVIVCPADQTVGTNPWFCNQDVILALPQVTDACGTPFTITPTVSAGTLVHFGGNSWRVDDLPEGTHTVTWTAVDACGNASSCSYTITVVDNVPPVPLCDEHTVVALTNDDPLDEGLTKIYAETFDDGSYDNCGPVTFQVRRMDSCIDFDWIGPNGEYPNNDGGLPESIDRGLTFQPWVPFACCDVGNTIMVELRVTDQAGNTNSCMVEVTVQDKIAPYIECPPDITVSCEFWFDAHETNGFEPADGLEGIFGRVLDAYEYDESDRQWIIIDDPGNTQLTQPHHWGIDGWTDDNCDVNIDVRTRLFDDCSGDDLPGGAPLHAVRLVERTFRAQDGQGNTSTCRQRIWVVDFDPFFITDTQCGLNNADDVRWPCDLLLTDCPAGSLTPDELSAYAPNNRPIVNDDNCSLIGVTYEDQVFYFEDGACRKILRKWIVIDWCQFDAQLLTGYWTYTQVIKIHDSTPAEFVACPDGPLTFCVEDPNVELPSNNQVFLGEEDPNSSACSAHIWMTREVFETCSQNVYYDVKVYPNNGPEFVQVVAKTQVAVDSMGSALLTFDTRTNSLPSNHPIRRYGLPYNDRFCSNWPLPGGTKDYHRILWTVEDGCGNVNTCEYLFRLEDCKKPSPVCVGLSSVVMPSNGSVTIWAKDFDASSFDDCTAQEDLLFSFSGTTYQPSMVFDCDAIAANGSPSFLVEIWAADEGNDQNCNGFVQPLGIEWSERNKDYCTTFIVIDDNEGVCGDSLTGGIVETEELDAVEKVKVMLTDMTGQIMTSYLTDKDGLYHFINPLLDYIIKPERNDNHKNGVTTLDLVAIQKHLLGLKPLDSPYKLIAADANNSESVSALDLVEIRKLILGLYTEFPKNTSWRFVDATHDFDDPTHPWPFPEVIYSHSGMTMHEDFVAMKIGDVNGTVTANATQVVTRGARNVLKLYTEKRTVVAGEVVEVPVTAENYRDILGYQFTMNLNGLKYEGIEPGVITMQSDFVGDHKNAITMSWGQVQAATYSHDDVLFTLKFVAVESGALENMINVSSDITEAEAYFAASEDDATLMDVQLIFGSTLTAPAEEYALYQNEPNPFSEETIIGFDLPSAMPATLTIYDMTGRVVRAFEGEYAAGYNQIVLKRKDLIAEGAYYYHLQAGDFIASKKMILTK